MNEAAVLSPWPIWMLASPIYSTELICGSFYIGNSSLNFHDGSLLQLLVGLSQQIFELKLKCPYTLTFQYFAQLWLLSSQLHYPIIFCIIFNYKYIIVTGMKLTISLLALLSQWILLFRIIYNRPILIEGIIWIILQWFSYVHSNNQIPLLVTSFDC